MTTLIAAHAEEALTELAGRFEYWRQTRATIRDRIPQALWDQAVVLSTVLSNSQVARRLRLSPTDLKKHRLARQRSLPAESTEVTPQFIEITPSLPGSTLPGGTEVEFERPDGARMRIRYRESPPPLAVLVQAFLERP
jgi:PAS domain-containing protein